MMKTLPAALSALLLTAVPVAADSLDTSLVDAEARLLIHADVERLVDTTLFQLLADDPEMEIHTGLAKFEAEIGLNLATDVRSITVYGKELEGGDLVGLLQTNSQLDRALERLRQEDDYRAIEVGGYSVHSFGPGGDTWYGYVFHEQDADGRLFVISENENQLVQAIHVVEGRRPSLKESGDPAVQTSPNPGSVLYLSVGISFSDMIDFEPAAEISKLVKSLTLELGEERGAVYANLSLESIQADDSIKVSQVIQGGIGLLGLISAGQEGALHDFVNALEVQRRGTLVSVSFRYDSLALYAGLRSLDDD